MGLNLVTGWRQDYPCQTAPWNWPRPPFRKLDKPCCPRPSPPGHMPLESPARQFYFSIVIPFSLNDFGSTSSPPSPEFLDLAVLYRKQENVATYGSADPNTFSPKNLSKNNGNRSPRRSLRHAIRFCVSRTHFRRTASSPSLRLPPAQPLNSTHEGVRSSLSILLLPPTRDTSRRQRLDLTLEVP